MISPFRINWEVVFQSLLHVFSIFGLCPINLRQKSNGKKKLVSFNTLLPLTWSSIHIVLVAVIVVYTCNAFIKNFSDISSFNNILKFSIMALTHFVALVESVLVRKNFAEIWSRVREIDDKIGQIIENYAVTRKSFCKSTSKKILISLLLSSVAEGVIITNIWDVEGWALMWILSIIPLSMSRMRHLQHTLYIDILSFRFGIIKSELEQIVELSKLKNTTLVAKNRNFYEGLFKRINTLKSVYNKSWETSLYINRSFGVSQLINLLQNFIQLTCDLYLLYSFLHKNNLTYMTGKLLRLKKFNLVK